MVKNKETRKKLMELSSSFILKEKNIILEDDVIRWYISKRNFKDIVENKALSNEMQELIFNSLDLEELSSFIIHQKMNKDFIDKHLNILKLFPKEILFSVKLKNSFFEYFKSMIKDDTFEPRKIDIINPFKPRKIVHINNLFGIVEYEDDDKNLFLIQRNSNQDIFSSFLCKKEYIHKHLNTYQIEVFKKS